MSARELFLGALLALSAACRAPAALDAPDAPDDALAWHTAESAGGTWRVRWRTEPDAIEFGEPARLSVEAERTDGTPAGELRVDAGMPQHGHGLLRTMQVESLGEGRFEVANVYLHMPGDWRFYLDLGRDGVFERLELALEVD